MWLICGLLQADIGKTGERDMNQLEILRESLGQCDEIILDALIMRNRIVEDIMAYKKPTDSRSYSLSRKRSRKNGWRRE